MQKNSLKCGGSRQKYLVKYFRLFAVIQVENLIFDAMLFNLTFNYCGELFLTFLDKNVVFI